MLTVYFYYQEHEIDRLDWVNGKMKQDDQLRDVVEEKKALQKEVIKIVEEERKKQQGGQKLGVVE